MIASGQDNLLKAGYVNKQWEIGLYRFQHSSNVIFKHDSLGGKLLYDWESIGGYFTLFFRSFFVETGLGKANIREKIQSNHTSTQKEIIADIYKINDRLFSQDEMRLQVGYRFLSFSHLAVTTFLQKNFLLQSYFSQTSLGLEIKLGF